MKVAGRVLASVTLLVATIFPMVAGSARTTATPDGSTVTVTVPIDLKRGRLDEPMPAVNPAAIEKAVEDFWNQQLSKFSYEDCVTIKVDAKVEVVADDVESGDHVIYLYPSRQHPLYIATIFDEAADRREFSSGPYDGDLFGWANVGEMTDLAWAHEFGHLLGLPDGYDHETGALLDGHTPSVMSNLGNSFISQQLVDGLGKLLEGLDIDMPRCERWEGEVSASVTGPDCNFSGIEGEVTLRVDPEGSVTGDAYTKWPSYPCQFVTVPAGRYDYTIDGTKTDSAFNLTVRSVAAEHTPLVLQISGSRASGTTSAGSSVVRYELDCTNCDE